MANLVRLDTAHSPMSTVPPEVAHPSVLAAGQMSGHLAELAEGAECAYDPQLHIGPGHLESAPEQAARVEVARQVCQPCPVRALCLAYALTARPCAGVWAGHTAEEIGHLPPAFAEVA